MKARGSSRQLKGHPSRDIGSKLGVGVIVQGAVSGSASDLHVTAELVRVADDAALWRRDVRRGRRTSWQPGIRGLDRTQAVIGRSFGSPATVRAARQIPSTGRARGTTNVEAYDRFLDRRTTRTTRTTSRRYIALFKEAIALDPNYARAHALIAQAYARVPDNLGLARRGFVQRPRAGELARTARVRSIPRWPNARAVEALVLGNELQVGPPSRSSRSRKRWRWTPPTSRSCACMDRRSVESGVSAMRSFKDVARGISIPYSGTAVGLLSYAYYLAGDYDAAITTVRAALDIDPANPIMFRALGYYYAFKGVPDSAVKAFETAFKLGPTIFGGRSNLVFGYAVAGRWDKAAQQRALLGA